MDKWLETAMRAVDTFFDSRYGNFATVLIILVITYLINRLHKRIFTAKMTRLALVKNQDPTTYTFFRHFISGIIYIVGITFALSRFPALKDLSTSLFASAGVLAVIMGFASQQAFSNIISGIFITIFKPFRVNDRVRFQSTIEGIVEDINLRHTVIRTFENKRMIIPNQVMGREIIENFNINDPKICVLLYFTVPHSTDFDQLSRVLTETIDQHPLVIDNRDEKELERGEPKIRVQVYRLTPEGMTVRARTWAENPELSYALYFDLNESCKKALDKHGIPLAYPHRVLHGDLTNGTGTNPTGNLQE